MIDFPANDNDDIEVHWVCNCGCDTYWVTPDGLRCTDCHTMQSFGEVYGD